MRESMDTIQNKTQKSTIKTSIEDTEIESLDKKKKKKKKKELRQTTKHFKTRQNCM